MDILSTMEINWKSCSSVDRIYELTRPLKPRIMNHYGVTSARQNVQLHFRGRQPYHPLCRDKLDAFRHDDVCSRRTSDFPNRLLFLPIKKL